MRLNSLGKGSSLADRIQASQSGWNRPVDFERNVMNMDDLAYSNTNRP
jgi:hypothetical protein